VLTRLEFRAPEATDDARKNYLQLVAAITEHFRRLNDKDSLALTQGEIDGTPIGANDPSTGKFTTLESTGNTTLGDAAADTVTVNAGVFDYAAVGALIKGDFTNATLASRAYFQTRTADSPSTVGVLPSGTATASAFTAIGGSSSPTNNHQILLLGGATQTILRSTVAGSGTQRPLEFQIGSTTRFGIETDGRIYGTALHNVGTVTGTTSQYIASGTYTPTFTNGSNCDSFTARQATWLRVGNVVTVSGQVDVDFTTAAAGASFRVSLPIASNFADAYDCAGVASCDTTALAATRVSFRIDADSTNDEAACRGEAPNTTSNVVSFHFTYEIL
jgi:hypothetical protein